MRYGRTIKNLARRSRGDDIGGEAEREAAQQQHRERVEEMQRHMQSARAKAEAEAREGDDSRLRELEDVEEHLRRRVAERRRREQG